MKIITIKQPWAWLIAAGIKPVENRTWPTKFRGRVLIHASAKGVYLGIYHNAPFTRTQWAVMNLDDRIRNKCKGNSLKFLPKSVILGSVEIVDCVLNHKSIWAEHKATVQKKIKGENVLVEVPVYNWVLYKPVLFDKPIENVKGRLSFWEYELPEEYLQEIERKISHE